VTAPQRVYPRLRAYPAAPRKGTSPCVGHIKVQTALRTMPRMQSYFIEPLQVQTLSSPNSEYAFPSEIKHVDIGTEMPFMMSPMTLWVTVYPRFRFITLESKRKPPLKRWRHHYYCIALSPPLLVSSLSKLGGSVCHCLYHPPDCYGYAFIRYLSPANLSEKEKKK
jgi:hypothetical protein